MFLQNMVEWIIKQMSYNDYFKIGDIVQFKHWIVDTHNLMQNKLIVENGIIIEKSDIIEYDWIVKGFSINKPIHLKESWIMNYMENK